MSPWNIQLKVQYENIIKNNVKFKSEEIHFNFIFYT